MPMGVVLWNFGAAVGRKTWNLQLISVVLNADTNNCDLYVRVQFEDKIRDAGQPKDKTRAAHVC